MIVDGASILDDGEGDCVGLTLLVVGPLSRVAFSETSSDIIAFQFAIICNFLSIFALFTSILNIYTCYKYVTIKFLSLSL